MNILLEDLKTAMNQERRNKLARNSRPKRGPQVAGSLESQYKPVGIAALTAASLCTSVRATTKK
ncbi:hypothetical protein [Roseibium album]|uniref:hypothetical protein n=1 Tax=Roseibium album TaxID=311410 RepID=UPI001A34E912|nr:hypothetical protein [Labrenzia sp. EL_162]MBG6166623.1 hypothetical protein [Labrenzia sp. EL_195]MBG6196826.1 hypothetical protein [Labrenzia sp. EL_159]